MTDLNTYRLAMMPNTRKALIVDMWLAIVGTNQPCSLCSGSGVRNVWHLGVPMNALCRDCLGSGLRQRTISTADAIDILFNEWNEERWNFPNEQLTREEIESVLDERDKKLRGDG